MARPYCESRYLRVGNEIRITCPENDRDQVVTLQNMATKVDIKGNNESMLDCRDL